jgi:hypothetical protein
VTTPSNIDAELTHLYTADAGWASDFSAKTSLLREIFGPAAYEDLSDRFRSALQEDSLREGAIDLLDKKLAAWLRTLPRLLRYMVERRSGLWSGTTFPTDARRIAEETGFQPEFINACYEEGLNQLATNKDMLTT